MVEPLPGGTVDKRGVSFSQVSGKFLYLFGLIIKFGEVSILKFRPFFGIVAIPFAQFI